MKESTKSEDGGKRETPELLRMTFLRAKSGVEISHLDSFYRVDKMF